MASSKDPQPATSAPSTPRRTPRRQATTASRTATPTSATPRTTSATASTSNAAQGSPSKAKPSASQRAKPTSTASRSRKPSTVASASKTIGTDQDDDEIDLLEPTAEKGKAKASSQSKPSTTVPAETSQAESSSRSKPGPSAAAATASKPTPEPSTSAPSTVEAPLATSISGTDPQVVIPVKKRGRPRKYAIGEIPPWRQPKNFNADGTPRGRGRPRKPKPVVTTPPRRGRPPKNRDDPNKVKVVKRRPVHGEEPDEDEAIYDDAIEGDLLSSYLGGADQVEEEGGGEEKTPAKKLKLSRNQETELLQDDKEKAEAKAEDSRAIAVVAGDGTRVDGGSDSPLSARSLAEQKRVPTPKVASLNQNGTILPNGLKVEPGKAGELSQPAIGRTPTAGTSAAAHAVKGPNATAFPTSSNPPNGGGGGSQGSKLLRPTTSDAYFLSTSSRKARGGGGQLASMSKNLVSSILPPLDSSKLEAVVAEATKPGSVADRAVQAYKKHMLAVYEAQLKVGYSILFHGVGSKAPVLLDFVRQKGERGEGVGVVVQGSMRGLRIEEILFEVERAAGIGAYKDARSLAYLSRPRPASTTAAEAMDEEVVGSLDGAQSRAQANGGSSASNVAAAQLASSALVSRAQRIASFFMGDAPEDHGDDEEGHPVPPRLFLLLLSFDAPALQATRFRPVLDVFASADRIHVMACVEHINAAMVGGLFSSSSASSSSSGGPDEMAESTAPKASLQSGGAPRARWLWQNLSTFVPPLDEMLLARTGSRGGAVQAGGLMIPLPAPLDLAGGGTGYPPSTSDLSHAVHSRRSLHAGNGEPDTDTGPTPHALLSSKAALQILKSVTVKARALFLLLAKRTLSASSAPAPTSGKAPETGLEYTTLTDLARRNFLASTETDLRALLVEFRDHGLVVRVGERVEVMLPKEEMATVVEGAKRI